MSDETTEALVVTDVAASNLVVAKSDGPLSGMAMAPVDVQKAFYEEYDERRKCFYGWLTSKLTEGIHYGFPPGCSRGNADPKQWQAKPSLYKAGALLLVDALQLDPRYAPDNDMWAMLGRVDGTVCILCNLHQRDGGQLSVGRGSMEKNEKRMGANARVKIAQKRALIDAVITGLPVMGDLFTQDMEELKADWEDDSLTDKQERRLESFMADPRLPQEWRDRIRAKMVGLTKSAAQSIILKSRSKVEAKTREEYVPYEETEDCPPEPPCREPGEEG